MLQSFIKTTAAWNLLPSTVCFHFPPAEVGEKNRAISYPSEHLNNLGESNIRERAYKIYINIYLGRECKLVKYTMIIKL